ncbi:MAG TPA: SDR family NAD(P)-dependent oxidoreductase [Candidatus Dormibacteraeota bacterium]|nr:SDR family NAD(P)-dependent oxidoreductase [Candidatus Dormibacteraeota bacterium]
MHLKDARVIVTGASSGIGRAIAVEFADRGASVVLAARRAQEIAELAEQIATKGGSAIAIPTDVTEEGAPDRLAQETIARLGRIDLLVNNAGIGLHAAIADASSRDVEALFRLNVLAAAAMIRAVIPTMRAQRSGMVINISSVAGRIAIPRIGYYSASKFALTVLGEALRLEEGHRGIRVMNVFPGTTRSNFGDNRLGDRGRAPHQRIPAVPAEKVARRIALAVERNRKSVYVSLIPDRMGVAINHVASWAVAGVLQRWARRGEA